MAYQKITCPKCGESHLHVEGDLFVCDVCESTFTKEEEASLEERLEQYHQMNQDIDLGHLRYLIRNELKKDIRDYKVILGYVLDVLKVLPEDFQALYFKHLCQYKKDPHMYDLFLIENKNAKISKYEKDFLYPFIIDECQYRSRVAVSEFLRGQNDFGSQEERLEKAMKQRELENDLFANIQRDVFICHSSKDNDKILPIIQAIERDGYTCWYSERNLKKDIDYYFPGIEEAIQSCRIFLVFMSTDSIMSTDVQWEINKAKVLNKKRIEYRLVDRNNNPLLKEFFAGIQWVDGAFKDATDELIERIYRELKQKEEKKTKEIETKKELEINAEEKEVIDETTEVIPEEVVKDSKEEQKTDPLIKAIKSFNEKQYTAARKAFLSLTENSNGVAEYYIGKCYENGLDVEVDLVKANGWYEKAAKQGHVEAQFHLGYNYEQGHGVHNNYDLAMEWYQKAAEQGFVDAQVNLGYLSYRLHYYDDGLMWFQKAAEQGNAEAQYEVGNYYDDGILKEADYDKALEWYEKAAEQGYSKAQYELGYYFEKGLGVKKDFDKALEWYQKAAKQGYKLALEKCRKATVDGNVKAIESLKKAAEQGYADAQFELGHIYEDGLGVEANLDQAIDWYQKAAELGNKEAFEKCRMAAVEGNIKAIEWFKKAAEQGNVDAQYQLGFLYKHGIRVEKNIDKAIEWYKKAAEQNSYISKLSLAELYEKQKDFASAVEWYEKAGEKNKANKLRLLHPFKSKK